MDISKARPMELRDKMKVKIPIKELNKYLNNDKSPIYFALQDKNYRKVPKKDEVIVYLNDEIYWMMANLRKAKSML